MTMHRPESVLRELSTARGAEAVCVRFGSPALLLLPWCAPGLLRHQTMPGKDRGRRLDEQQRLRELRCARVPAITTVWAHDPVGFERLAARRLDDFASDTRRAARPD